MCIVEMSMPRLPFRCSFECPLDVHNTIYAASYPKRNKCVELERLYVILLWISCWVVFLCLRCGILVVHILHRLIEVKWILVMMGWAYGIQLDLFMKCQTLNWRLRRVAGGSLLRSGQDYPGTNTRFSWVVACQCSSKYNDRWMYAKS